MLFVLAFTPSTLPVPLVPVTETLLLLALQEPPVVASVNVNTDPAQIFATEGPEIDAGLALSVTTAVVRQPVPSV